MVAILLGNRHLRTHTALVYFFCLIIRLFGYEAHSTACLAMMVFVFLLRLYLYVH